MRKRTVGVPLTREQFSTLAKIAGRRSKSSVLLDGLRALETSIAPAMPPQAPRKGERSKHASAYLDPEACARLRKLCLSFRWNECEVLRAALECLAQQMEEDDRGKISNRMDGGDLEPGSRVQARVSGVRELLCNAHGRKIQRAG